MAASYPRLATLAAALLVSTLAAPRAHAQAAPPSLEARLQRLFDRPDELPDLRLRQLILEERRVLIGLEIPARIPLTDLPPAIENRFEDAVGMIDAERPAVRAFELFVAHPGEKLKPAPKRARLSGPPRAPRRLVLPDPSRFPDGQALAGKVIAISPGHGYIYYDNLAGYSTQRGRVFWTDCGGCRGIVEDFETSEIVRHYLVPLLEGAGAQVVLVRERDGTGAGHVVDDGEANYREVAGTFVAGPTAGARGATTRQSSSTDATVEWTLTPASSGPQLVSLWWPSAPTLSTAARVELTGPFGPHRWLLDLSTHGRRWTPLATLDLDAGAPITVRVIGNGQAAPLVFDAARVGSGRHASTNHLWWEMGADPFIDTEGVAPTEVTSLGDVTTRPAYAEWQDADVYFALHSNASGQANSTAVGTSSYRYSCGTFADHATDPPASECDDPPGSDRLQELVHARFIEQVRADWDPNWRDRGTRVANFGEVRQLVDMPGMLMESAFHDNVVAAAGSNLRMTENQALHDPRWRRAAAMGLYRGLSEFLVGAGPTLLPPPTALVARRRDDTSVELTFAPVAGATRYRVYVAQASRAFDQGRLSDVSTVVIDRLMPEVPVAITVATLNAAGEGLKSNVVVARPSARRAQLLVVDAFEREDAWVEGVDNKHDTAHVHARALAAAPHAFDGATEAAWTQGLVTLMGYEGLVLALGRESTEHGVLTAPLRDQVAAFVTGGGAVMASGSEIGWTLDTRGDATARAFLTAVFGASLAADTTAGAALEVQAGGWLGGVTAALPLDDGSGGGLEAKSSDSFTAAMGAVTELTYAGGTAAAAVRSGRNLLVGVALDSIASPEGRAAILGAWANNAVTPVVIEPPPDGGVVVTPDGGVVVADSGVIVPPEDGGVVVPPEDGGVVVPPSDAGAVVMGPDGGDAGAPVVPTDRVVATSDDPIRGGCGCATHDGASRVGAGWLLAMLWVLSTRRRAA